MVPTIITIVAIIYIINEKSKLSRIKKSGNSKCWEYTPEAKSLRKVNTTIAIVAIVFSIAIIIFGNSYINSWIDYVFDGCKYSIEEVKSEIGYEGTSEELVNELLGFEVYTPNSSDNSRTVTPCSEDRPHRTIWSDTFLTGQSLGDKPPMSAYPCRQ